MVKYNEELGNAGVRVISKGLHLGSNRIRRHHDYVFVYLRILEQEG